MAVADAADRGLDPGLEEPFRVSNGHVLPAPVAMMGEAALRRAAVVQGLLQGIEDEGGMGAVRDTRQPTMRRATTSMTQATRTKPCQMATEVESDTRRTFGCGARNCRFT
jgi:hypothetical protein